MRAKGTNIDKLLEHARRHRIINAQEQSETIRQSYLLLNSKLPSIGEKQLFALAICVDHFWFLKRNIFKNQPERLATDQDVLRELRQSPTLRGYAHREHLNLTQIYLLCEEHLALVLEIESLLVIEAEIEIDEN